MKYILTPTTLKSNLTFTGNTTFQNRHYIFEALGIGAGAILAVESSLQFTGTNNFFDNVNSLDKLQKQGGHAVGTWVVQST